VTGRENRKDFKQRRETSKAPFIIVLRISEEGHPVVMRECRRRLPAAAFKADFAESGER